jgi:dihydropteroate synthase
MGDAVAASTRPRPAEWPVRGRVLSLARPIIVGIVNVTPDSFSDGGRYLAPDAAIAHAETLVAEGADLLDVGGESTRPQGALPIDAAEELRRVVPVVRDLVRRMPEVPVSVDTVKAEVARAALDVGAAVVNDVSGFRLDPALAPVCAQAGVGVILMHSRGGVSDMGTYAHATYGADVTGEVVDELGLAVARGEAGGVAAERIVLDPGIGFAKRSEHSLRLLAELPRVVALGHPVLVGVSRKRFIGELTGVKEPEGRVFGTTGANVAALARGARLFRVHDVRAARHALDVAWAALGGAA